MQRHTMKNNIELLSPAGSLESLYAAVHSGCNAVYFGGKEYSARSYASNFTLDEMKEAVAYCKPRGVKTYLTLNTAIKQEELRGVYNYLSQIVTTGIDGVIVQDMGIANLIAENFKNLELHGSTQMTAHSLQDVLYLKEQGFRRVVLSRELSLPEISRIVDESGVEIEVFIHGALCYSYSGQCLMSSVIGGRSGNRGRCAQPCRLPYQMESMGRKKETVVSAQNQHLLSLKDIQSINLIPQLIKAGVASLKIEGRMKRPEYVAGVTAIYRKYMDQYLEKGQIEIEKEDQNRLLQLFNRGGFSTGYLENKKDMIYHKSPKNQGFPIGKVKRVMGKKVEIKTTEPVHAGDGVEILTAAQPHPGGNINKDFKKGDTFSLFIDAKDVKNGQLVYRTKDHHLMSDLKHQLKNGQRKGNVDIVFVAKVGEQAMLTLRSQDKEVTVVGPTVEEASNRPMDAERYKRQLGKLGQSPFTLENFTCDIGENTFISVSSLNELRREGVEKLVEAVLVLPPVETKDYEGNLATNTIEEKVLTASVVKVDQCKELLKYKQISTIYLETEFMREEELAQGIELCREQQVKVYLALPQIQRSKFYRLLDKFASLQPDGYLVRTYGQLKWCQENADADVVLDYTFNVYNNESLGHWCDEGVEAVTLSTELNGKEISKLGHNNKIEVFAYGRLPVMVTEQCTLKDTTGCTPKDQRVYALVDRMGNKWPVKRVCRYCYNKIYNIHPLYLIGKDRLVDSLPVKRLRLSFTFESTKMIAGVVEGYLSLIYKEPMTELAKTYKQGFDEVGYTNGHFTRGVE